MTRDDYVLIFKVLGDGIDLNFGKGCCLLEMMFKKPYSENFVAIFDAYCNGKLIPLQFSEQWYLKRSQCGEFKLAND